MAARKKPSFKDRLSDTIKKKPLSVEEKTKLMQQTIKKALVELIRTSPFFASQALYMPVEPAPFCVSGGFPTMATNGEKIFFHPDLYDCIIEGKGLIANPDQLVTGLAHEILHCDLAHFMRQENRNKELWNMAADYAINAILKQMGFEINPYWLYKKEFENMSAERIYYILMEKQLQYNGQNNQNNQSNSYSQSQNQGQNQGIGQGQNQNQSGRTRWQSKNVQNSRSDASGSGISGGTNADAEIQQQVFDRHLEMGLPVNPETGEQYSDTQKRKGKQGYSQYNQRIHQEKIIESWKRRLVSAAMAQQKAQSQKGRGFLPRILEEYITEIKTPSIPLIAKLQNFLQWRIQEKANWNRPNRKMLSSHSLYLPTYKQKTLKIAVVIDTSGSISKTEAGYFLGITKELVEKMDIDEIRYIECDTDIHKDLIMTKEEFLEGFDVNIRKIKGRGGTSFCLPFEKMEKEDYIPDALIYLTDGVGEFPEKAPYYPVLWIYSPQSSKNKPPFGEKITISKNEIENSQYQDFNNYRQGVLPSM